MELLAAILAGYGSKPAAVGVFVLRILHADPDVVVVVKPAGLVTHPSRQCQDQSSLLAEVRNALGHWVFPVHRLDRPTSGLIVFGSTSEAAAALSRALAARRFTKRYLAVVRGHLRGAGVIDKPLQNVDDGPLVEAVTRWRALAQVELPWPVRPYETARYSLVELEPVTGRTHQLRKHLRALSHPIVGDRMLGDGAHNRVFAERTGVTRLLLHAHGLGFPHPRSDEPLSFQAPPDEAFAAAVALFPQAPDVGSSSAIVP